MILALLLACAGSAQVDDTNTQQTHDSGTAGGSSDGILTAEPHDEHGSLLVVRWDQDLAGDTAISWTLDGQTHSSLAQQRDAGPGQLLLAGLPYGTTTELTLLVDGQPQATVTASTDALPEDVPQPQVLAADSAAWDPEVAYVMLSTSGLSGWGGRWWTTIIDRQGRIVWARESPSRRVSLQTQISSDGADILIDHNSFWGSFDNGAASEVVRLKLDGTVVDTHPTPGLHHPYTELPDGRLAWGATDGSDELLVLGDDDGSQTTLWTCEAFLDELGGGGYCGSNTLRYDAARDSFLFSFYSIDTVIEVDAASGQTLRWFGQADGSYAFDPEDSAFWWQHGVHWTDAGTLLVSTKNADNGRETLVREYRVDEHSGTLTQIWSFGEGEGVYGGEMGEAWRLAGGNTLHNYGSTARLREVTPQGSVAWDLDWGHGLYIGRMTALSSLDPLLPAGG